MAVFNVSNKFGFLNISDSEDEIDQKEWLKAKKTKLNAQQQNENKKKPQKKTATAPTSNVVGFNNAPSQNIINSTQQGGGASKNAKRRAAAKKKKEAEAAKVAQEAANLQLQIQAQITEEEAFQKQLDDVIRISKSENDQKNIEQINDSLDSHKQNGDKVSNKKKKKGKAEEAPQPVVSEEDETVEEEDLFVPVIEDIKDVIKKIIKEDEIPITEIPIDNNQLLRKRALELQDINSEFKLKLNGLLRIGYKYKKKYDKEKVKNRQLNKVINRCDSNKKTADLVQTILEHEEREHMLTKQIEELSEDLQKERTKLYAAQNDKKGHKKVSFSET